MKTSANIRLALFTLVAVFMTSCLTVEKKSYSFDMTGENSGKLTIRYINILSVMDDGQDVTSADFQELLDKYINGDQLVQDFPGAANVSKRLYVENDQLCGEVIVDFTDLSSARLYQYDARSPIMMCISAAYDSETYVSSNGSYGNDYMPVVFWPSGSKKMEVTTSVTAPDETRSEERR
ncbi:MAG: hypothetical protein HGA37_01295, partial [Lentimicrobium sp.]|nr:hypothetical protein [Lentimicrobium sp.]